MTWTWQQQIWFYASTRVQQKKSTDNLCFPNRLLFWQTFACSKGNQKTNKAKKQRTTSLFMINTTFDHHRCELCPRSGNHCNGLVCLFRRGSMWIPMQNMLPTKLCDGNWKFVLDQNDVCTPNFKLASWLQVISQVTQFNKLCQKPLLS